MKGYRLSWMRRWAGAVCLLAMLPVLCAQSATRKKRAATKVSAAKPHHAASTEKGRTPARGRTAAKAAVGSKSARSRAHVERVAATAESRKLASAFTASAQLRPMAQQLLSTRTAAAYSGVAAYAGSHSGEASSAAHIALGHAYALDHRYPEALAAFRLAATRGDALADYADFLGAQAAVAGNRGGEVFPMLDHFAERHPGSIFTGAAPVLLANAYLQQGNGQGALAVLTPLMGTPAADRTDVRYALGKAYQATGNVAQAAELYRGIYLKDPLSNEAAGAKTQLAAINVPLTAADRKQHADAMFNTKHYLEAQEEYRALGKNDKTLTEADKDALQIYEAVCDLRLKKLGRGDVSRLPVTNDDSAALKLYLESELRRNDNDFNGHDALIAQMLEKYPHSRWLEEALYSGGNMYSVKRMPERAIGDYSMLVKQFPTSTYAPSAHWRVAWMSYRLRRYPDAARLMDEQIRMYPAGTEIPGALYWRARLYEDVEHDFGQALNYYAVVNASYVNSYYAILSRQRTAVLGKRTLPEPAPALAFVKHVDTPQLTDELPENDPNLIKARLLANAGLNEYIGPEIQASATASSWGALAQAE